MEITPKGKQKLTIAINDKTYTFIISKKDRFVQWFFTDDGEVNLRTSSGKIIKPIKEKNKNGNNKGVSHDIRKE